MCRRTVILLFSHLIALVASGQGPVEQERLLLNDPRSILNQTQKADPRLPTYTLSGREVRDIRELPSNIHVITQRQIEASGARDLMQALKQVPGFDVVRDGDEMMGLSVHGLSAIDGKCLFLLNGNPLNDLGHGTHVIGHQLPMHQVERIEVVLGAGPHALGDQGALAVVNIVTFNSDQDPGSRAVVNAGFTDRGMSRVQMSINGAHRLDRKQEFSYFVSRLQGQRSNALQTLPDGQRVDLKDSTEMEATAFQINYRWRNLRIFTHFLDEQSAPSDQPYRIQQRDIAVGLEHRVKIRSTVDLIWKLLHREQLPWYFLDTTDPALLATNTVVQRTGAQFQLNWQPTTWSRVQFGALGGHERHRFRNSFEGSTFTTNGRGEETMDEAVGFGEIGLHGSPGNLAAGFRLHQRTLVGTYSSSHLGYAKVLGRWSVKMNWSISHRLPTLMNLNYVATGQELVPERVIHQEALLNRWVGNTAQLTASIYRTTVENPIYHTGSHRQEAGYQNSDLMGTEGVDLRFTNDGAVWVMQGGAGVFRPVEGTKFPEAEVNTDGVTHYQAVATRAMFGLSCRLRGQFTVRARATWRSSTWSYQWTGSSTRGMELMEWPELWLVNVGISMRPTGTERFVLEMACNNLLDERRFVLSPLANGQSPMQMNGREISLTAIIQFAR